MALLREVPSPDAVAAMNYGAVAKRARDALDRRLDQLEHEHEQFLRTLAAVERAVQWLPDAQRVRARRQLRQLGHDAQLDPFAKLATPVYATPREAAAVQQVQRHPRLGK